MKHARKIFLFGFALLLTLSVFALSGPTVHAVSGAISTTDNPGWTDAYDAYVNQACLNGNGTNCNIYNDKRDVWMSGLPVSSALGAGTYFFAVLDPGGQNDPNDGTTGNLSSPNDAYTNRTFSVDTSGVITYSGTHDFDSTNNKLQLYRYNDTSNPGGVYILAVCQYNPNAVTGYPGVTPSSCKYDAFKIGQASIGVPLAITKDATGAFNDAYKWSISKSVDQTLVKQSGTSAIFNYTVKVTHDGGTVSGVKVTGKITVTNPNVDSGNNVVPVSINGVTDQLSDGTVCTVTNGGVQTLNAFQTDFAYECDLTAVPQGELDNTATVTWSDQFLSNGAFLAGSSANFTFASISFNGTLIDNCVSVTDTLGGALGTVCLADANPTIFTYSYTVTGTPGTCVTQDNTATFTTNTTGTTGSAGQTVKLCVGANLSVTKTATPSFTRTYNWKIQKAVDKTLVEQIGGGTATLNYTVVASETGYTDSAWAVKGQITVANPNDWESVTVTNVTDLLPGASCSIDGGFASFTLAQKGTTGDSKTLNYTCTFASAPTYNVDLTNTATASWDPAAAYTPDGSASGSAKFQFTTPTTTVNKTVTITDTFNGTTTTLGTLTATDATPYTTQTYTYSRTVSVPTNNCVTYPNTAKIVETGQTASQSVEVCGPAKTGALTMGFWQNKNGQTIIKTYSGTNCQTLETWLNQFHPFSDLTATACGSSPSLGATSATGVVGYVYNVVKNATCTSTSQTCNSMLKAQMLATALDVYFSDPALGGNRISAPAPIGGVKIDLTKICVMIDGSGGTASCSGSFANVSSAFGGATSMTVLNILLYQNTSDPAADAGAVWYGQVKATQVLAKNAFDAINNQVAFAR